LIKFIPFTPSPTSWTLRTVLINNSLSDVKKGSLAPLFKEEGSYV
jgi:hypothetical protein